MSDLKGKTLFITGASRGIGKAIGIRAAKDGANVVIAAKTAEPHPKLEGTVYTAAKEIEAAGGKALPLVVDIRFEDRIAEAAKKAKETFGGIDILVNNASAIMLTGTLSTPMKRYDLMHSVNTRGTYATTQACLPLLLEADNPHVLNISPPLSMKAKWFGNHVAYTMAKYGMSMCVLGHAEEFKGKVAFNALWPRTAIATAAVAMLGGDQMVKHSRTVELDWTMTKWSEQWPGAVTFYNSSKLCTNTSIYAIFTECTESYMDLGKTLACAGISIQ
ncbi:MAG: NAD(P)-dependent oxidoreductase [Myxococcota bacterium]